MLPCTIEMLDLWKENAMAEQWQSNGRVAVFYLQVYITKFPLSFMPNTIASEQYKT